MKIPSLVNHNTNSAISRANFDSMIMVIQDTFDAFGECSSLEWLIIPKSYYGCDRLKWVVQPF